ncbi:hypothetical protein BU25DRAFT_426305 [Macroventuria anomochaeta]|uniref:Uncharacterized protein n=1 Tax=Macroventuria anomochaeta TaxID=301207 RepID=A0ACB6RIY2_9PLEO|nr:uncharacterized protein BU25DRAFT_426305 [Macroventuria anomochaeta]KAF2621703.1 hypothetical protein BU25DRAFT_426305 [Macroventuria anomochaeta]
MSLNPLRVVKGLWSRPQPIPNLTSSANVHTSPNASHPRTVVSTTNRCTKISRNPFFSNVASTRDVPSHVHRKVKDDLKEGVSQRQGLQKRGDIQAMDSDESNGSIDGGSETGPPTTPDARRMLIPKHQQYRQLEPTALQSTRDYASEIIIEQSTNTILYLKAT